MLSGFLSKLFDLSKRFKAKQSRSFFSGEADVRTDQLPVVIPAHQHGILKKNIDKNALAVVDRLVEQGHEAYLVGGSVRDFLVGERPKDFDVVTDAHPQQIRRLFRNSYIIGRRFRLVHVRFNSDMIEVATFRAAHSGHVVHRGKAWWRYSSGRKNKSKSFLAHDNVYGTLIEDAFRRDISINALYYSSKDGAIIDYTGGFNDLKNRCICIIGHPRKRYKEDPVRMIRVLRFAAKLGFALDAKTAEFIPKMSYLIRSVPKARLFLETVKLFYTGCAQQSFLLLRQYGLFQLLFSETQALLEKDPLALNFLTQACCNTDQRYAEDLPLNSSFLFAVMLWPVFQEAMKKAMSTRGAGSQSHSERTRFNAMMNRVLQCASETIKHQSRFMDIPQRVAEGVREIWKLQYCFQKMPKQSAVRMSLFRQRAFKAAYDFLLLRAQAGEPEMDVLVDYWTQWYKTFEEKKYSILHEKATQKKRAKRRSVRPRKHSDGPIQPTET